jgi:hypothetical protein
MKGKQRNKLFYNGVHLRRPVCLDDNCIWIRGTAQNRTLVVQCSSAKVRESWIASLRLAAEHVSGGVLEKQFTEAQRLQRIAYIDQVSQKRINRLEGTLHTLSTAVMVAQKEVMLGSRGVRCVAEASGPVDTCAVCSSLCTCESSCTCVPDIAEAMASRAKRHCFCYVLHTRCLC